MSLPCSSTQVSLAFCRNYICAMPKDPLSFHCSRRFCTRLPACGFRRVLLMHCAVLKLQSVALCLLQIFSTTLIPSEGSKNASTSHQCWLLVGIQWMRHHFLLMNRYVQALLRSSQWRCASGISPHPIFFQKILASFHWLHVFLFQRFYPA